MAAIILTTIGLLRLNGRIWWCTCGSFAPWKGAIWSEHCSQHLFDPYSFSHVLHGFLFFWLISLIAPRLTARWKLLITVLLEAGWELLENSAFIIHRYREATIDQGYSGDSIFNSVSDMACCILGFFIARKLGFRLSLLLFATIELILLFWVRDNLTLNIIMLIHPVEAIKHWQMSAGNPGLVVFPPAGHVTALWLFCFIIPWPSRINNHTSNRKAPQPAGTI